MQKHSWMYYLLIEMRWLTDSWFIYFSLPPPHISTAIDIGFTRQRIYHNEQPWQFETIVTKSRESEQTFYLQIEVTTLLSGAGQSATLGEDFQTGGQVLQGRTFVFWTMSHYSSSITTGYLLHDDLTPENPEVFQLSITPAINSPRFGCSITNGCYQQIEVVIIDDDGGLSNN